MRRSLLDQVADILPNCPIFNENAFYPRRYFDDLMLQESAEIERLAGISSME
jgi:hypothetical protein